MYYVFVSTSAVANMLVILHALLSAIKTYCFGNRKRDRGRSHAEDIPMGGTVHVQLQPVGATPNIYCGTPDLQETADLGERDSTLQEKAGEQITLE